MSGRQLGIDYDDAGARPRRIRKPPSRLVSDPARHRHHFTEPGTPPAPTSADAGALNGASYRGRLRFSSRPGSPWQLLVICRGTAFRLPTTDGCNPFNPDGRRRISELPDFSVMSCSPFQSGGRSLPDFRRLASTRTGHTRSPASHRAVHADRGEGRPRPITSRTAQTATACHAQPPSPWAAACFNCWQPWRRKLHRCRSGRRLAAELPALLRPGDALPASDALN